jgi:beta-galactosamide-alpha-2,3-sialyltransferase
MRSKLEYHYTIYPNHKNLTNKVIPISLKNELKPNNLNSLINEIQSSNTISIFLGSPIENANLSTYLEHPYESILNKIKIDFYYPHPRENFYPNFKILDYPSIFEEFILDLKLLKPNLEIKIYSFGSSVHLNLINLNNIQHTVINRKDIPINNNILNIIKLYNIEVIEI